MSDIFNFELYLVTIYLNKCKMHKYLFIKLLHIITVKYINEIFRFFQLDTVYEKRVTGQKKFVTDLTI